MLHDGQAALPSQNAGATMKHDLRSLSLVLALLIAACSTEQVSRGVYEGSRTYNKNIESTPLEKSKNELPPYDQFEKERREGTAK